MLRALVLAALAAALVAAPAASAKRAPLPGVVTPTGNIRCFYVPAAPAHLLCTIHRASYTQLAQDRCMNRDGLDWHGWSVYATRAASMVCSGGILYNSNKNVPAFTRLAYGRAWRYGPFTCTSRSTGLTCVTGTGHGLFLSRASFRSW